MLFLHVLELIKSILASQFHNFKRDVADEIPVVRAGEDLGAACSINIEEFVDRSLHDLVITSRAAELVFLEWVRGSGFELHDFCVC